MGLRHGSLPFVTRSRAPSRRDAARTDGARHEASTLSPHPRPSRPRPQPARAVAETAASLAAPAPASGGSRPFTRAPPRPSKDQLSSRQNTYCWGAEAGARVKGRGRLSRRPELQGTRPSRPRPWQAVAVAETAEGAGRVSRLRDERLSVPCASRREGARDRSRTPGRPKRPHGTSRFLSAPPRLRFALSAAWRTFLLNSPGVALLAGREGRRNR